MGHSSPDRPSQPFTKPCPASAFWCDVALIDAALLLPLQDGVGGQARAVVAEPQCSDGRGSRRSGPVSLQHGGPSSRCRRPSHSPCARTTGARMAHYSPLKSSMTHSPRNHRPQVSASEIALLERHCPRDDGAARGSRPWFGPREIVIGARVPRARFRPRRLRTVSRSSRWIR